MNDWPAPEHARLAAQYEATMRVFDSLEDLRRDVEALRHEIPTKRAAAPVATIVRLAVEAGILIAVMEIAVGLGTLLGIAPLIWAVAGLAINVILFMSATWHVHPYFLGSDSIYAVAWAAYLVALVEGRREHRHVEQRPRVFDTSDIRRREFIRGGVLAAAELRPDIAT